MTETTVPWTLDDMLEVTFDRPDKFNVIAETLTRMGSVSKSRKMIYPHCVLLHKKGRYFICHFKEMMLLDGDLTDLHEDDLKRRNTIAKILEGYGLLTILDEPFDDELIDTRKIKVIKHSMIKSGEWKSIPKYVVGNGR